MPELVGGNLTEKNYLYKELCTQRNVSAKSQHKTHRHIAGKTLSIRLVTHTLALACTHTHTCMSTHTLSTGSSLLHQIPWHLQHTGLLQVYSAGDEKKKKKRRRRKAINFATALTHTTSGHSSHQRWVHVIKFSAWYERERKRGQTKAKWNCWY